MVGIKKKKKKTDPDPLESRMIASSKVKQSSSPKYFSKGMGNTSQRCVYNVCACSVTQSCLTFCDAMDCSPPGYSVH